MGSKHVVFHILNELKPGGAEQFVVNLLRFHNRDIYQPVCICLRQSVNSHLEKALEQMRVPFYFLRVSRVKLAWLHNMKLNRLYKHYRPTVVHTHLGGLGYAWLLSMKHRTPVRLYTVHSIAQEDIGTGVGRRVRLLAFRYRIGGWVPVAISEEVARTVEQVYSYKEPPLIPNGIPVDDYTPSPSKRLRFRQEHSVPSDTVVIAHVGRFADVKNHTILLRAFSRLNSVQPLQLWLVGDGELRPAMELLAQELGVANRVRFWGVRSDVADILNAADIFTLPSKYEGNPMSVMEAMAAGLPVVATAVGGVPELVEEGVSGFLTPSGNPDALADALQRLVDDPNLRRHMGAAALQRAHKKFDIRHTVRAYEALYESILQQKQR